MNTVFSKLMAFFVLSVFLSTSSTVLAGEDKSGKPGWHVKITEVSVDPWRGLIKITGENFDFATPLQIQLGDTSNIGDITDKCVPDFLTDPQIIECDLGHPSGILFGIPTHLPPDGAYLLVVRGTDNSGQSQSDEYDLNITATAERDFCDIQEVLRRSEHMTSRVLEPAPETCTTEGCPVVCVEGIETFLHQMQFCTLHSPELLCGYDVSRHMGWVEYEAFIEACPGTYYDLAGDIESSIRLTHCHVGYRGYPFLADLSLTEEQQAACAELFADDFAELAGTDCDIAQPQP